MVMRWGFDIASNNLISSLLHYKKSIEMENFKFLSTNWLSLYMVKNTKRLKTTFFIQDNKSWRCRMNMNIEIQNEFLRNKKICSQESTFFWIFVVTFFLVHSIQLFQTFQSPGQQVNELTDLKIRISYKRRYVGYKASSFML